MTEILQPSVVSGFFPYGESEQDKIGLDISCNLSSIVIPNLMKSEDMEKVISNAIDLLDSVARSTSINSVPGVKKANDTMRSIGLGAMGLHSYLANNEVVYGSKEALDFVDTLYMTTHFFARKRSMEIARDTGFIFKGFEDTTYADGSYFSHYLENDYSPKTDKGKELFEGKYIPSQEDWKNLVEDIKKHGLAHSFVMATPPTGKFCSYKTT